MKIPCVILSACWLFMAFLQAQEVVKTKAGEPALARKAPVPLHCEVLSASGKPVAGAKVHVSHMTSRDQLLKESKIAEGTTDAGGSFHCTFTPPAHWRYFAACVVVDAGKEGIGVGTLVHHPPLPGREKMVIQLLPATDFKATILTPEGKPAAGLEVWVRSLSLPRKTEFPMPGEHAEPSHLPGTLWRAITDEQGRLVIPMIPEGASVCLMHADKRWAQFKGRYDVTMRSPAKTDGPAATLQLAAPGSIRGRILLPDGKPAGGSIVSLIDGVMPYVTAYGDEVKAAENGEFIFDQVPPSTYTIHYDTQPPLFESWIGAEKKGIVVSADKSTDAGDLMATEAAYVMGEVRDAETGKEIEEPIQFRLTPGHHDLFYLSMRYPRRDYVPPSPNDTLPIQVKGGERKTIVFKLRPVKEENLVRGVVVNEEGKPVPNAQVVMQGHGGASFPSMAVTDANGEFTLMRQKGSAQETVLAHHAKAMSDIVLAVSGQTMTLRLREEGWGKVVGTVADDDGKPVADASISWYMPDAVASWGLVQKTVKSDAAGRFEFPRFWSREEGIYFFCKAGGLGSGTLRNQTVRDGQTTELKFVLKKAEQSLSGVLVDSSGKPVPEILVRVSGEGQSSNEILTDAEGKFRLGGLARGQVHLSAMWKTESFTTEASQWVKAGAAGVRLEFPAADGELSGVVVDASGKPVTAARVESFERGRKTSTDKDGRFTLSGMVQGWCTVKAEAPNPQGEQVEKEIRLKTGMKDAKIALPAAQKKTPARPLDPVDLIGKPAPQVEYATWVNCEPLPPHGRGKVRILDFWGLKCGPCIAAFPKVQKFWETHRDKGIDIVAVTGFFPEEEVKEFMTKHPTCNFPVALYREGSTLYEDYDVRGIPTYVVIDAFGKIVSKGHDFEAAGKAALELVGK